MKFYLADWKNFIGCLFDTNLRLKLGTYLLFSGEKFPVFFIAEKLPIDQVTVQGKPIAKSYQYKSVVEILDSYPSISEDPKNSMGREYARIRTLIDAYINRSAEFTILLQRIGRHRFEKVDGGHRLAIAKAMGREHIRAVITLRGETRF